MEQVKDKKIDRKEALRLGILQNNKITLKPVERGGRMISDKSHVGYFMFDGATVHFCLPQDSRGVLVSPFKSVEEKEFFERELDVDLNVHKKEDNYWKKFFVRITKDASLMYQGESFDLSDPLDNLRVRVLKMQNSIADGWDNRFQQPEYKFVLVPDDFEDLEERKDMEQQEKIWTYWGSIKDSAPKMKDFLDVYLTTKKSTKETPSNPTIQFLTAELGKIFKSDRDAVIRILEDKDSPYKLFVAKAVKVGAIEKTGANSYNFVGEGYKYGLDELIKEIKHYEETTDDIYLKIKAQIERAEQGTKTISKKTKPKNTDE